ncbi:MULTISPECIES: flagellar protein FlaG [Clostridium]|uniref:flagellar protein FlaG n=1 Tax=Clostridium TaxID=1485 RepID=UPI0008267F69|nr:MULTISPECIES: flagellar protein FlaG [Clostridium]PJI09825.1 hypothetical protein CUB90_18980 [Clostridium sp. CT7]
MDVEGLSQGRQNLYSIDNSLVDKTENVSEQKSIPNEYNPKDKITETKEVQKTKDKINKIIKDKSTHIEYEQDKRFKSVMVMKVIDNNTRQVVNEIPSKQMLDLMEEFYGMAGLVLNKKA